jgi:hypothetical protein
VLGLVIEELLELELEVGVDGTLQLVCHGY